MTDLIHEQFLEHTKSRLDTEALEDRFASLKTHAEPYLPEREAPLRVLDLGCGMGIQSLLWAQDGYSVTGLDLDDGLLDVGRRRAEEAGIEVEWVHGSASDIPLPDQSFDVCLSIELLEHVPDWERCLREVDRVLKPGGLCVLTTTNSLCPKQSEFRLPAYSWWPGFLKRRMERMAVTTHPKLVNFSEYPAVNWFSYFSLKRAFDGLGFDTKDRIDAMDLSGKPQLAKMLVGAARRWSLVRALLYIGLEGTVVFVTKRAADCES